MPLHPAARKVETERTCGTHRPMDQRVPPPEATATVNVLVLCTGNAARSVMAGYMLEWLGETQGLALRVATGGTHALDGQPMSSRTRAALATVAVLADVPVGRHRSRQVGASDMGRAHVVVAMEADHVRYVRRHHPAAADRTATLKRLCRELPPGSEPIAQRLRALELETVELGPDEDVADPAGGDDEAYVRCAAELWELCQRLVERL